MACAICQQIGSPAGKPQGLAGEYPWQCQHELIAMHVPGFEYESTMTRYELQRAWGASSNLCARLQEALEKMKKERDSAIDDSLRYQKWARMAEAGLKSQMFKEFFEGDSCETWHCCGHEVPNHHADCEVSNALRNSISSVEKQS